MKISLTFGSAGERVASRPQRALIRRAAGFALVALVADGLLDARSYEAGISFVGIERMQRLNREYAHKDAPTDVLSFRAGPGGVFLGDIAICTAIARQSASEYAHSIERELAFLAIHGILHLAGLDHESSVQDAKTMQRIQESALQQAGVMR